MKKFLSVLGATALLCSNALAEHEMSTLKVGTEALFAPFNFSEGENRGHHEDLKGFDIDIIRAIAKEIGYEVEFVVLNFDELIPAVITEQIDLVISALTITSERAKLVDFSDPYFNSGLAILVKLSLADSINSTEDLANRTVCVSSGTTASEYAQNLKDSFVVELGSEKDAFIGLNKGECDTVISDRPNIEYFLKTFKDPKAKLLSEKITVDQYGIITAKHHHDLADKIQKGLHIIQKNGTYDKIYMKWFGNRSENN